MLREQTGQKMRSLVTSQFIYAAIEALLILAKSLSARSQSWSSLVSDRSFVFVRKNLLPGKFLKLVEKLLIIVAGTLRVLE